MRRLVAGLLVAAGLSACGPAKPPADCTVLMSRPGSMGLPLDLGSWTPVNSTGYTLNEWWARCQGHYTVIKVDERGPKPNPPNGIPFATYLRIEDCVFEVDPRLASRPFWDLATLDPNYAWNN